MKKIIFLLTLISGYAFSQSCPTGTNPLKAKSINVCDAVISNLTNGIVKSSGDSLKTAVAGADYSTPSSLSDSLDNYLKNPGTTVTDNSLVRFDGSTGRLTQGSSITCSDAADVAGISNLTLAATLSLTSSTGNSSILFRSQSNPSTPLSGTIRHFINTNESPSWRNSDGFVRTFNWLEVSANRTWIFPDADGQVELSNNTSILTNKTWNGAVIGSSYGGAGTVNGILKANGSGTVSAAVAGTDYPDASLTSGEVAYANGTKSITSEAAFAYNNTTDVLTLTGSEVVDTLSGSTSSGGNLQLQSTTHATKGKILFGSGSAYDGVSGFLGVGTQSPSGLLNLSGNFTTSAWTTNGVRLRAASQTFTDNSSSGNVANVYMDVFGTPTYAASSAVTVTGNLIGAFYMVPAAGANVTAPNLFSLGTQGNILSGGSIQLNNGGTNTGFTVPNATNFRIQTGGSNVQRLVITGSTGLIGVGPTAPTPTAHLHVAANTASNSSFRIEESATDPSSPNAGDVWNNAGLIKQRTGGVTYIISKTLTNTATLNFDLTSVNYEDLTITVTGAADGDAVSIAVPNASATANVVFTSWVSATNTVTIRASRIDVASGADPASGTFRASVIKY